MVGSIDRFSDKSHIFRITYFKIESHFFPKICFGDTYSHILNKKKIKKIPMRKWAKMSIILDEEQIAITSIWRCL